MATHSTTQSLSPRSLNGHGSEYSTATSVSAWQRQRREEILLLKKSVPSKAELLRIMDSHPMEGERLVRFCHSIKAKIRELEAEYRASVEQSELARVEEAKARAAAQYAEKKREVIEKFMEKTLTAEDRQAELAEQRRREKEAKLAADYVRREEAEEERRQREAERLNALEAKRTSWNRAVAMVAERRASHKIQSEARIQRNQQEYFARRQAERQAHAEEQAKLSALARKLEVDVYEHDKRHQLRLQDRQLHAARFAQATIAHPETFEERVERLRAKAMHKDHKIVESHAAVEERKKAVASGVREDRETRLAKAQERLAAQQELQEQRARAVEAALHDRLQRHSQNIEARHRQVEAKAEKQAKKMEQCKSAVQGNQENKFAALSQKIIDRTLRIGSALGVELPPVLPPSTMYITASEPRPERVSRRPVSAFDNVPTQNSHNRRRHHPARSETAPPDHHHNTTSHKDDKAAGKQDAEASRHAAHQQPRLLALVGAQATHCPLLQAVSALPLSFGDHTASSADVGKGTAANTEPAHLPAPLLLVQASTADTTGQWPLLRGLSELTQGATQSEKMAPSSPHHKFPLLACATSLSAHGSLLHSLGMIVDAPVASHDVQPESPHLGPSPLQVVARMTPPSSAMRFISTSHDEVGRGNLSAAPSPKAPPGLSLLVSVAGQHSTVPALCIVIASFSDAAHHQL